MTTPSTTQATRIFDTVAEGVALSTPAPDLILSPGDYVFVPLGETHEGVAEEDALFLVIAPGGVIPREQL
jgi:ribosomal protein L16 Arg81 hydroxylase